MRLCVNIDHVATLRNARGGAEPDPVEAALACERAGADGIVCHLREDRRHIRDRDVELMREKLKTKLDLEMAATKEIVRIAIAVKPDLVTLVPEKRKELTTEGGLDVVGNKERLRDAVAEFHHHGIAVSLFVDPVPGQIVASKDIGADMIELHTGWYANAPTKKLEMEEFTRLGEAARLGSLMKLEINAGHGLDYRNIGRITEIAEIGEVSIGHALIVHALSVGLESAVAEMQQLIRRKRPVRT